MATGQDPAVGKLYRCTLKHGTTRICRYGYHRMNNDRNWDEPPAGAYRPSCLWNGWRDHGNFRFIREEEVLSFIEVTENEAGQFIPVVQPAHPA